MTTAPASDLKFSQSHLPSGVPDFFLSPPARACATAFDFFGGDFFAVLAMARWGQSSRTAPRRAMFHRQRGDVRLGARPLDAVRGGDYLMCLLTSLVISNIETLPLPPNTGLSLSSALIMRRSFAS